MCFSHTIVSTPADPSASFPVPELNMSGEATHVSVRAVPGAVFVLMRRDRPHDHRRMFAELTLSQARAMQSDLAAAIREATTAGVP
ncbi:MAG TPA: hypothetical protein VJY39_21650 [Acidisphaera sp.]|nr:hypothetical protein [Acidisphaera sp.]